MKKVIIGIFALGLVLTAGHAFAISDSVIEKAVEEAAGVAKEAINKNKSEVTMNNTEINNEVEMDTAASIGNTGVKIIADKVDMQNVELDNKVKLKRSINVGNAGISVGKE